MKHSSRNILLKISPQHSIEGKFYSQTKENNIIENAEQIFHETFSNDFFNLMENVLNSKVDTYSIGNHNNNIFVPSEVCYAFQITTLKTWKPNNLISMFQFSFLFVQEINTDSKDELLNFILPGCLIPLALKILHE